MIALIGHGYLGMAIANELARQAVPFAWLHHDLYQTHAKHDAVINAGGVTGYPNVDECETKRARCVDGNVLWPLKLERDFPAVPIIHIGSGCIYQGGIYTETMPANFTGSFYSACKAMAERALQPYLGKSYILRLRMPFGREPHSKNLLTKLAAYPRLIDARNSLTCLEDAARVAVRFATTLPPPGIYNCTNPGAITTREVTALLGLTKHWFASDAEFLATVKAPRSNCVLDSSKLRAIYPMPPVREALIDCITHLRQDAA